MMRRREDRKVGRPKAQKLWRFGEAQIAGRIVREDMNAKAQMEAREVV
jgi:hypothetical protein